MKTFLLVVFALASFVATASQPIQEQFINGSGIIITNSTTVLYAAQNVLTYDAVRIGGPYNGYPSTLFYSKASSNMQPTVISGVCYWTNFAAYSSSAPTNGGVVVNTNIIRPYAWVDVPAFCDGNAQWGQGCISITTAAGVAATTNTLTCVFAPVLNEGYPVTLSGNAGGAAVEGTDKLTLVVKGGATVAATSKTNLPAAFMYGARKIRLVSVVSSADTANITISKITLSGYTAP